MAWEVVTRRVVNAVSDPAEAWANASRAFKAGFCDRIFDVAIIHLIQLMRCPDKSMKK